MVLTRACKRCGQNPKFNHMYLGRDSYSIVCCTTITGRTWDEVINKWNIFNQEAKLYRWLNDECTWEEMSDEEYFNA